MTETLLEVKDLSTSFHQGLEQLDAVKNISFTLKHGETLAIVGESGSGKSVTAHSILGLLPGNATHASGEVLFDQRDLLKLDNKKLQGIRGDRISMIFQEPMTALNPLHRIGKQIAEMLILHQGIKDAAAKNKVIELLRRVHILNPEQRFSAYPHELSGGERQRVMIAMAIANKPDILIADEPTTALDVTVQAEILSLLRELQSDLGMGILLITHDLGIVKNVADRVANVNKHMSFSLKVWFLVFWD